MKNVVVITKTYIGGRVESFVLNTRRHSISEALCVLEAEQRLGILQSFDINVQTIQGVVCC